jgi:hypothetical protein
MRSDRYSAAASSKPRRLALRYHDDLLARGIRAGAESDEPLVREHGERLEVELLVLVAYDVVEHTAAAWAARQHHRKNTSVFRVENREGIHVVLHDD